MANEEIKSYLEEKAEKRDYTEGYNLFCRFSKNQCIQRYLARKMDREKLFYELGKMQDLDTPESKIIMTPIIRTNLDPDKRTEVEVRLHVSAKEKIDPSTLPESLKIIYDQISEDHNRMRSLHEKMKLVKKEKDREGIRKTLLKLAENKATGWVAIDNYFLTGELPAEKTPADSTDPKAINAARKYISVSLKALDKMEAGNKRDLLIEKTKERYSLLLKADNKFDEATLQELQKHGIIESGKASD